MYATLLHFEHNATLFLHRDFLLLLDICYKLKRTPYIIRMRLVIPAIRYEMKILCWETQWEEGTLQRPKHRLHHN
jgi:hypothetical protein